MQEATYQFLYRFFLALCGVSVLLWFGLMGMVPFGIRVAYTDEGDLVFARTVAKPAQGAIGVFSEDGARGAVTIARVDGALRQDGQLQYYRSEANGVIHDVYSAQTFRGSAYAVVPFAGLLAQMLMHPVGVAACIGTPLMMLLMQGLQNIYTRREIFSALSKRFTRHYTGI